MTTPISFELAKLLKEKKQNIILTKLMYASNGKLTDAIYDFDDWYFAPTIAEVVMWLYEKHGIWISVLPELYNEGKSIGWYFSYYKNGIGEELEFYFKTPTESYDAAITYTLNNLI